MLRTPDVMQTLNRQATPSASTKAHNRLTSSCMLVTVTDDTAEHSAARVADNPSLTEQTMVLFVVGVTYRPSVPITHQTRPVVPDEQVTVAQQSAHLEIMGMAPGGHTTILGCLPSFRLEYIQV